MDLSYNIRWLNKAKDQGSKSAAWELAKIQFPRNEVSHEQFLRAAMDAAEDEGNPWAATELMQLTNGRWGSRRKPTECGQPEKTLTGKCAPDDLLPASTAAKWARIAAQGGNVAAQEWLCVSAANGRPELGQPEDKAAAYKWCGLAAHNACSFVALGMVPDPAPGTGMPNTLNLSNESLRRWKEQPWRVDSRWFFPMPPPN